MSMGDQRIGREQIQKFTKRSTPIALCLFIFDITLYFGAIGGVVYFDSIYLKIACSSVAATMISSLFVIGHDAAHGAFTDSKKLNDIIGRIVFLPSLHNYSLWQVVHNRLHHGNPNLKTVNSWSPMSFEEYESSPTWRKYVEKIYRTPIGFGPYYLIERWWKHKFYPWGSSKRRATHLKDFWILIAFLSVLIGTIAGATKFAGHSSIIGNLLWAMIVPFAIWNSSMGWTTYIQHTHERIPWFRDKEQWERGYDYGGFTPYIRFPRWFGYIFHDINEHTAHHLAPKIPCYRLFGAQQVVANELKDEIVAEKFSVLALLRRMRACKLYDFEKHRWTGFNGEPTTKPIVVSVDVPVRLLGGSKKEITLSDLLSADSESPAHYIRPARAAG